MPLRFFTHSVVSSHCLNLCSTASVSPVQSLFLVMADDGLFELEAEERLYRAAVSLTDLPNESLLHMCLHGGMDVALVSLCCTCKAFRQLLYSIEAEPLWKTRCQQDGVVVRDSRQWRQSYVDHLATRCRDCAKSTSYKFSLLDNYRLCEKCERSQPHKYGLATLDQMVHERSLVAELTPGQRRELFGRNAEVPLRGLEICGFTWYLRAQALAAAARVLRVGESGEASDDGEEEGGKDALANIELTPIPMASQIDHDGVDGEAASLDSISRSWEESAAQHSARRPSGVAERKKERDEKKAHKKKVKAEQRERRETRELHSLPAGIASARGDRRPGSSHKPKRPSAHEHRSAAQPTRWELSLRKLEEDLGADLCGLSGLVLA